jgi:hypothetical protein
VITITFERSAAWINWIFSIKTASAKSLILQELSSHYKMAPDKRSRLRYCMILAHWNGGLYGLNGSGRSGSRFSVANLQAAGFLAAPQAGSATVSIPGALDGYLALHARFGSMDCHSAHIFDADRRLKALKTFRVTKSKTAPVHTELATNHQTDSPR